MLSKIKNKNDSILSRVLSLLLLLFVYKGLCYIPIPWINSNSLDTLASSGIFTVLNTFNDSAFINFTFMATGISSYVGASIILQILSFVFPNFSDLNKTPGGKKVMTRYTVILGIIIAFISSLGTTLIFQNHYDILTNSAWYVYLIIALMHSCGTFLAILIGENITKLNFGNGCSILIFSNIISATSSLVQILVNAVLNNTATLEHILFFIGTFMFVSFFCLILDNTKKNIPIQYSQTTVRSKIKKINLKSYYKIRLNISGIIPIIFSMSIFQGVNVVIDLVPNLNINAYLESLFSLNTVPYFIILSILIFIFNFMYTYLVFSPKEISESLQHHLASFPNIRMGSDTETFLRKIRNKMCFWSSFWMSFLIITVSLLLDYVGINTISATSIAVLISVSSEIFNAIYSEIKIRKINL